MNVKALATTGLLAGGLITLIWQAPASWLGAAVASASGQRMQLQHARGTLWNGSAQLTLATTHPSASAPVATPGRIQWQIRPAWLGLDIALTANCCTPKGALQIGWRLGADTQEVRLVSRQSVWPAALLAAFGAPWNTLAAQGRLQLDCDQWRLTRRAGQWSASGPAQIDALDIHSPISTLQPLGSYRLNLDGEGTTRIRLQTLRGDLQLQGEGSWSDATLRFRGTASAAPGREEALNALLNIIGQRQGAQSIISLG